MVKYRAISGVNSMNKEQRKEIKRRVASIVLTSIYFISMTILSMHLNTSYTFASKFNGLSINDLSEGITYMNAFPIEDSEGLKQESYVFEINNSSNSRIKYIVGFENVTDQSCEILDYKHIRYSISTDNKNFSEAKNMSSDGYLTTDVIDSKSKKTYYLKFWIDYNATNEVLNKSLDFKISITQFDTINKN